MSAPIELTYDDALQALLDTARAGLDVSVVIKPENGPILFGMGGRLRHLDDPLLRGKGFAQYYAESGGDEDFAVFSIGTVGHFVLCPTVFQRATATPQGVLAAGEEYTERAGCAGVWRALTIIMDGVEISVSVMASEGVV